MADTYTFASGEHGPDRYVLAADYDALMAERDSLRERLAAVCAERDALLDAPSTADSAPDRESAMHADSAKVTP